jgi:hypothetical protein
VRARSPACSPPAARAEANFYATWLVTHKANREELVRVDVTQRFVRVPDDWELVDE